MGFFFKCYCKPVFFHNHFFSQLKFIAYKCKSLSHDRLLPLTQQMSTFLTLMKHDVLKEHIKIRKKMERLRKSDYEEIISRDSAGKSQYRDTSIIHILFQSENLWKRKQFSEAVSRKNKSISKQYFISLTMIWYI